jgi:hypothetical protein
MYYVLACLLVVFFAEHLGRKFGGPRPSALLQRAYDAAVPVVKWVAGRMTDALCFLAVIDLAELFTTAKAVLQPSLALVGLPLDFVGAVALRITEVERPITFVTGSVLVAALAVAHIFYPHRIALILAADALVAVFAVYNTIAPAPPAPPVSPPPKRRTRVS